MSKGADGSDVTYEPPERLNVADYFLTDRLGEGRGDRVALRLDEGDLTYADVEALACRFATCLSRLGVRREERVMISLPDGAAYVGALFGVLKLGAVVVMVNPGLGEAELADLLAYCRPRLAVVEGGATAERFLAARDGGGEHPHTVLVGAGPPTGALPSFEQEAPAGDAETFPAVATHRDEAAIWLFSGGTTGRPKAVVQTHGSFANTTELYAKAALGYRPDDVTLAVPKLFFGYATGSNLLFPFSVGASAVLFPEKPTAEVIFERVERHRPTILINVPTVVNRMVTHPDAGGHDLSSLRFATSAGEALPPPLYRRWKELFGVELLDGLGTAEMWHIFLTNLPGDVTPGTLGRAVPGFEVRVRDDGGRDVEPGEVGRLWVKGRSRALGYWQNLEQTVEAFRGPWFVGGDLVRMDDEGRVTYCGRGDDVMKVAGRWCAPSDVESCLLEHPEVTECAVVGAEDPSGLTKPYAFVVATDRPGLADELKAFTLERLAAFKHPRRVVVVDDLPRTHLGKVDRGKLKAEAERVAAASA